MKPYLSVIVFLVFLGSSLLASIGSYQATQTRIEADMQHALSMTLQERPERYITPDTIRTYRSHLTIGQLRDRSFICYDTSKGSGTIQCYSTCSFLTVLSLSDQRLSLFLSLMAILWAVVTVRMFRRHHQLVSVMPHVGTLYYSSEGECFVDQRQQPIRLTPMQHQLMTLFFQSPSHRLAKEEICSHLWPGKEDANDTLYTLIRRLKPVLEAHSNVQIEADRGRAYHLTVRDSDQ